MAHKEDYSQDNYLPIPNYSQIPNFIIDEWMAKLTPSEFKVIMLILRYTAGFHRRQASISFQHFEEKTGVSNKWIRESCKKFEMLGWIKVIHGDHQTANIYEIQMKPGNFCNSNNVCAPDTHGGPVAPPSVVSTLTPNSKNVCKVVTTLPPRVLTTHYKERDRNKRTTTTVQDQPKTSNKSAKVVVVPFSSNLKESLQSIGFNEKQISKLAQYKFTEDQVLKALQVFKNCKKTPDNPVGWLIQCIRESYEPKECPLNAKESPLGLKLMALNGKILGTLKISTDGKFIEFTHTNHSNATYVDWNDPDAAIKAYELIEKHCKINGLQCPL